MSSETKGSKQEKNGLIDVFDFTKMIKAFGKQYGMIADAA
jgi:hypothetical protein